MSKFNIVYNEYSQQFITLPLTLKNVSGEGIKVNSIFIKNIADPNTITQNDILFYFDETQSNYTQATTINTATYNVLHSGLPLNNQSLNKKDKINYVFTLENTKEFDFLVVFNPNINKHTIKKGGFYAQITINFSNLNTNQSRQVQYNVEGESSDKVIATIQNIQYNNINSIFDIQRSQIINLN